MLRCVSDKFPISDFDGHSDAPPMSAELAKFVKTDRRYYYSRLSTTRFGLALPGLGYDCFRTWELMTMGAIIVVERGVGLDKTVRIRFFE